MALQRRIVAPNPCHMKLRTAEVAGLVVHMHYERIMFEIFSIERNGPECIVSPYKSIGKHCLTIALHRINYFHYVLAVPVGGISTLGIFIIPLIRLKYRLSITSIAVSGCPDHTTLSSDPTRIRIWSHS